MKCRHCKQDFGSMPAYGIHTWMARKEGRKTICPSPDALKREGMSLWGGQWFFLSEETKRQKGIQ